MQPSKKVGYRKRYRKRPRNCYCLRARDRRRLLDVWVGKVCKVRVGMYSMYDMYESVRIECKVGMIMISVR